MNSDIRLAISFKGHRKRAKLERLLGDPRALNYLIDLWLTVALDRPEGILIGWDVEDIASAAGYFKKNSQKLVDALIGSGWLDQKDGIYILHDWEEHQGWASGAKVRSESARKAALAKHAKYDTKNPATAEQPHCESIATAENKSCDRSAPYPSPILTVSLPKPIKDMYGEFNNVLLAKDEHQKLIDKFGEQGTKSLIERLSGYIASKGVKYKSHYATLLSWERKDKPEIKKEETPWRVR